MAVPAPNALKADPEYRAAVIDLLGVLAYGELTAFERIAADGAMSPTIDDKIALAALASGKYAHFTRLGDRLREMGVRVEDAMEPFKRPLDEFHAYTAPSDWLEGMVKAYVGDGIGADFYLEVSNYVDTQTQAIVQAVCGDASASAFIVDRVRGAIQDDPRCAGRLALWGRRLVGEALSQAQRVAADRDALSTLLVGGVDRPGADLAEIGRMLARMTENHTRRMSSLGLAA
ncbi:MAG: ferritin-like domain-containing protein [Actinomycetales bacterium]|nr:ferritin-like domain-containing protein [Actinomycetales bacterium]